MEQPDIPKIIERLKSYAQYLEDHAQRGNSKLMLAFAEIITVMSWSSEQQDKYSKKLVRLTWWIVALTVAMLSGLVVQIILTF